MPIHMRVQALDTSEGQRIWTGYNEILNLPHLRTVRLMFYEGLLGDLGPLERCNVYWP